jgi:type II secretory pathway pseudopilin PulG
MHQVESIQVVRSQEAALVPRLEISLQRRRRDSGAMLLAVLFMMAVMVIAALAIAPSLVMQMKRDREAEMIHRGTEYARAIKKYYKKFGRYPANLEQLDNTNQIRFLRRRYKDPLTKDGEWRLLHYGDIASVIGANGVGIPAAQLAAQGGAAGAGLNGNPSSGATASGQAANSAQGVGQPTTQQPDGSFGTQTPGFVQPGGATSPSAGGTGAAQAGQSGFSLGPGAGQNTGVSGTQGQGTNGQTGTNNSIFGNTGVGGQTFGGGAIVGVASKSKDPTIRLFNKKKTYDEWQFIYSPMMDAAANTLLRGPYNGQVFSSAQIGTPAGQLNQTNPGAAGPFGQRPGGFGQQNPQQNPQQNQQQNQQMTPGGQFPPDQSQPQPQY